MNEPRIGLGACERVTLGLRRLLDPGGGMDQEGLAAHARACPDCGTLLVVAREVASGVGAARAAIDAVEPRSYVRDFSRLLERALDEHRRALADLFHEIGKAYVYETSAERLKIVTVKPPGNPSELRERARRTLEGAARLAPAPPAWTVEGELLRLQDSPDPEVRVHAAGRFLEATLRLEPGHEAATTWLALQRESAGRDGDAIKLFEKLVSPSSAPSSRCQALVNLARFSCREDEYASALALTVLARDLDLLHPVPVANLALYALYVGEPRLVAASLTSLANMFPDLDDRTRLLRFTVLSSGPRTARARREHESWLRSLRGEFPELCGYEDPQRDMK